MQVLKISRFFVDTAARGQAFAGQFSLDCFLGRRFKRTTASLIVALPVQDGRRIELIVGGKDHHGVHVL